MLKIKMSNWRCWLYLAFAWQSAGALADSPPDAHASLRILSWNISGDSFVSHPSAFHNLLRVADPDVLLLDEVAAQATDGQLRKTLAGLQPGDDDTWYIDIGTSGGRQRGLIASRAPLEALPEFSSMVPYPEADRRYIRKQMTPGQRSESDLSMENGIPVNAAVIRAGQRRLLVVITDLQCCGSDAESWQEFRRRVEVREIRRLLRQVLQRITVDGVVVAGDFNLVNGATPLVMLTGPYSPHYKGLIPAELYHRDGSTSWTWDGRGTRYPSGTLDFQLYSPQALMIRESFILDSEDLSSAELERFGIKKENSRRLSRHRPLLVEYVWQQLELP